MPDDFVTGALPSPTGEACDEVSLRITLLVRNGERIVARFNLDSPYWTDEHESANGVWSLCLPRYEMAHLLCTLLKGDIMKVSIKNEELLCS